MKIKSLLRIINLPFKAFYKLLFLWKNLSKRNQKIVTITSIIVILVMIPIIFYSLSHLRGASAAWFNDNWGYRQIVAITNAGSAKTDFQVAITLNTDTLCVNGKLEKSNNVSGTLYDSDAVKRIGTYNNPTPSLFFPGQIDNVKILTMHLRRIR